MAHPQYINPATKTTIALFGSYSHEDPDALELFNHLNIHLRGSKHYDFGLWTDRLLLLGENWDARIKQEMERADAGLLLVSPSFVTRPYIKDIELPRFLQDPSKVILPVLLHRVDFDLTDLLGIEDYQIYSHEGRSFGELDAQGRRDFLLPLNRQVHSRIKKVFG